jgi:microcystin-dependent protein
MATPFIGQIVMFAGTFAPRGWAFCNGQILSIAQNTALFSILGTTYGGNGQTTFALPDLRGRVPVHPGQGPGLSNYVLGQSGGAETVTLNTTQIPAHAHSLGAFVGIGQTSNPTNNYVAAGLAGAQPIESFNSASNANLAPSGSAGGSQPHANIQPYKCINFIIALEGIYPSRN